MKRKIKKLCISFSDRRICFSRNRLEGNISGVILSFKYHWNFFSPLLKNGHSQFFFYQWPDSCTNADCRAQKDCASCTAISNLCGWCDETNICSLGSAVGPNLGICNGWEWGKCQEPQPTYTAVKVSIKRKNSALPSQQTLSLHSLLNSSPVIQNKMVRFCCLFSSCCL